MDIVLGIVGAVVGGWIFQALGITIGGGVIDALIASIVGAVIVLVAVKLAKKA
jgi:uncharacterized membrane protein YeaQ/YmgE (transglycosylase-associated protein family)